MKGIEANGSLVVFSCLRSMEEVMKGTQKWEFESRKKAEQLYVDLKLIWEELIDLDGFFSSQFMDTFGVGILQKAIMHLEYNIAASSDGLDKRLKFFDQSDLRDAYYAIGLLKEDIERVRSRAAWNRFSLAYKEEVRDDLDSADSSNIIVDDDKNLVSYETNMTKLVMILSQQDYNRIFVSGRDGSGKTTLAKKVYEDSRVRTHFERFAWVDASNKLMREVWEGVLVQLFPSEKSEFKSMRDAEEIKTVLLETLKLHKCLVVLEDVCNFEVVPDLHEFGSRILVTSTQTPEPAMKNCLTFELETLSEEDSFELLCKRLHVYEYCEDVTQITELGREMVRYCQGLPLAIVILSQLLRLTRFNVKKWEKILHILDITRSESDRMKTVDAVLNTSYHAMPIQLKQCLLHLAQFPENHEIRTKELCRIWIALGFVVQQSDSDETNAYECLRKLVGRGLVQVRKWSSCGRVKTCCIHNAVRKFCSMKSRIQGFHIVDFRRPRQEDVWESRFDSIVHSMVCHVNDSSDGDWAWADLSYYGRTLKSFMCFNAAPNPYYERVLSHLLNFRMLRVLKFENTDRGYVGKLSKNIMNLLLLRFFSLKNSHVSKLPSSIGKLRNLQTLDLRTNWRLEIPIRMSELVNLTHLYLPDRSTLKGGKLLSVANLGKLRTLVNISTEYFDLKDLMELKELVKLRLVVVDVERFEAFESTKVSFDKLESLSLENCTESRMDLEPFLGSCPRVHKLQIQGEIDKLILPQGAEQYLTKLWLKETRLEIDPMVMLGKLETLAVLVLDYGSFTGEEMVCSSGSFPCLQSLALIGLELKEWRVGEAALMKLGHLEVDGCDNLRALPDGVRGLATLEKVERKKRKHIDGGKKPNVLEPMETTAYASLSDRHVKTKVIEDAMEMLMKPK